VLFGRQQAVLTAKRLAEALLDASILE